MSYQRSSYRGQPYRSNVVDVEVHLHWATEKAVLVSLDGNKDTAVWVPKSLSEWSTKTPSPDKGSVGARDEDGTITLPENIAKERGLI